MSYGKDNLYLSTDATSQVITLTATGTNTLTVTSNGAQPVVSGIHTLNVTNGININSVAVATQEYVSNIVQGRTWRPPVRAASTAALTLSAVDAGFVLDDVTLVAGNRVLIKDQGTNENGIYVVQTDGTHPVRASDMAGGQDASHAAVVVGEGTANLDKAFLVTNNAGSAVIGTNTLTFVQFGGSSDVADGSITAAKLASDAVTTIKILDANVTAAKLATDAVTTAKIAAANVTAAKMAPNSVATTNIQDDAVTTAKILNANVTTAKILDGNVTEAKLATDAVTTDKIAAANVTAAKLASNSVFTAAIQDDAVTSAKIADGTIVAGNLADDAVTSAKILDGTIVEGNLADQAVTSAKIADLTIVAGDIASNAITTAKILDANVTAPKLASTVAGAGMVLTSTALDSITQTLSPVVCATTANVNLAGGGIGATVVIDGITLTQGDRILVKNQTSAAQNGIFIVPATGAAAARASDMATGRADQVKYHATVFVALGTAQGQTTWRLASSNATYPTAPTIDTNTVVFAQVQLSNSSISSSAAIVASKIAAGTFGAGTYSFASSTITDLGTVTTANIDGGTIDGATIATSNITVGSGKALTVSGGGTLTTNSLTATDHLDIGSYNLSAASFLATSDRDTKTNIETMRTDYALECVRQMKGVKFDWKSNGEPSVGVIAQDMQEITPELVGRNPEGKLSFNYDGLNGYLIPAIQYLAEKCEDLEEEVDKLKRKRSRAMMSDATEGDDEEDDQPLKAQPRLE